MLRRELVLSDDPDPNDPVHVFSNLLRAALANGKAYLLNFDGREPASPTRCGWHKIASHHFVPRGIHVGWINGDDLLLISDVYEVLEHLGAAGLLPLCLLSCATRRTVHGRERPVLHMNVRQVLYQ
jgi:hypothetical protein